MKNFNCPIEELKQLKKKAIKKENEIIVISINEVEDMAKKYQFSPIDIEIAALNLQIIPSRYERNFDTLHFSEQIQLLRATVAVIGCGGLGGNNIELLSRLGIGNLILIDGDRFSQSNLNRQGLCVEKNIGKLKTEVAAEKVKEINSGIRCRAYPQFADSANMEKIIKEADLAIDALDNIPSRFVLGKACQKQNIPLIHGAINGFIGQVSTLFPEDKGMEAIYGPARKYEKKNKPKRISTPSVTPALIASLQVTEAIKVLLNRGVPLRNRLLLVNLEETQWNIVEMG